MGKDKIIYKLIVESNKNKIILYKTSDIFEIDCFTYQFNNKQELLKQSSNNYGYKFHNAYIEIENNDRIKITNDIMYKDYYIPTGDRLNELYFSYLMEDKKRIKTSFLYKTNKYKNRNVSNIEPLDLMIFLSKNINSYTRKRECYFTLVKEGLIKIETTKEEKHEKDYLTSIVEEIETSELTDEHIIIEKIKQGKLDPDYYDIEQYLEIKKRSLEK